MDTKAILPDITLPFSGAAYQAGSMGFAASLRSLLTPFERQALSGFGSPVKQICRKLLWIRDLIGNLFPALVATQPQTSDLLYLIKAIYTLWTLGHCAGGGTLRLGTGVDCALTANATASRAPPLPGDAPAADGMSTAAAPRARSPRPRSARSRKRRCRT